MKRIMVMGISPGVGKSTFARSLGKALNIPVYHLDALFWKPGWVETPIEEFSTHLREILRNDHWIIEGNYSKTYEMRAELADAIIYLELPLPVCLYRVLERWFMNIGKTRLDMGAGCKEKIDWPFIKFICTTYYPRREKKEELLHYMQTIGSYKTIVKLKGKRQIQMYLETMKSGSANPS